MLADGHRKFIPSQCVSPPKLFRHSGGHAGLGDDAVHLFLLVQDDEVGGAAGDQQVEAVLGAVPCVDGGGVAADQGLDGLDHMAGEADVRNGHGALIAVLVVHHDQGVHVAPLHLADALVDAPAGGNGGHARAHEVGGSELLLSVGVDEIAQKVLDLSAGGVGQHLFRRRHLDDVAVVHEDNDVGQIQSLRHVVGDEDEGLVQLLLEALHLLLQGAAGHGVQGAEGLIHQDDRRGGGQCPEDADALLLSAGHLRGVLVGVLLIGHLHHGEHVADDLVALLLGVLQQLGHHADVLGHRHVGEQADLLDHIADVAAQLHLVLGGDVLLVQIDLSRVGLDQTVYHLQCGGLTAAGGADEHGELPLLNFKAQIV